MRLDIRTIVMVIIIGNLLMSLGMFSVARGYLGKIRGVSHWATATLLQALGWIIVGPVRTVIPEPLSIVLGNALILLSLYMYRVTLAKFTQKTLSNWPFHLLMLFVLLAIAYFSISEPNLVVRNIIISSCWAVLMLSCTWILLTGNTIRLPSHVFTASILAMCAFILLVRAVYFFNLTPDAIPATYGLNSTINDISGISIYLFGIMVTFGFILMCNDRYIAQQQMAEGARILALEKHQHLETSLEKSYEALSVSEQRLRRLMNSSLIGIVQADGSGRLNEANDVLLQLIQTPRQALLDGTLNWFDLIPASALAEHKKVHTALAQHEVIPPFECLLHAQDGSQIPVMLGLSQLEGDTDHWVGFVVDLREQQRVDKLKSAFISIISHELRTPLTSIKGSLGLLEGGVAGQLPPKALQLIQIAYKNSMRLGNLVNDILDVEKITSGKLHLNLRAVDLVSLAKQALQTNANHAAGSKIHCELVTAPEQAMVMGDADRLVQVLVNLLSNAVKFSPSHGEVTLRIMQESACWRVEVEDHGAGIPVAFQKHIFEKFAQADGSSTRQLEGVGLGLNIAKSLLEQMGGKIGFSSEKDIATVFWFTLPCLN
jgi:PAS domain S-box-containing protein